MEGYPPSLDADAFERADLAPPPRCCRRAAIRAISCASSAPSGVDTGAFDDRQRFDSVLDQLAALRLTRTPATAGGGSSSTASISTASISTASVGTALSGALGIAAATGDRLVACVGLLAGGERGALARAGATSGNDVIVVACSGALVGTGVADAEQIARVRTVRYGSNTDFDRQWAASFSASIEPRPTEVSR